MKRRIRWIFAITTVLLACIVFGAWMLPPHDGLLDHATLLTRTEDWDARTLPRLENFWLNDQEVFYLHREANGSLHLYRKTVLPPGNPQAAVDMRLSLPAASIPIQVSPDRRYLSYFLIPRAANGRRLLAPGSRLLSMKDGKQITWKGEWLEEVCWTPDGNGIISVQQYPPYRILTTDIESQKVVTMPFLKPVPAEPEPIRLSPLFAEKSGRLVCIENGPYFLPQLAKQNKISASQVKYINMTQLNFVELDMKQQGTPLRTWSIPVPQDVQQGRVYPSPQHDRLLWVTYSQNVNFLETIIQRVIPHYNSHTHILIRWQISVLNGKNIRDVVRHEVADPKHDHLSMPQWNPDGKRLSFIYNNALYTTPVSGR